MFASARSRRRCHGWLALAASLAVHALLGVALALLPCRGGPASRSDPGPPVMGVVEEEADEEGTSFLVARPGPATNQLPQQVGATAAAENIVPVVQVAAPSLSGNAVEPAVYQAPAAPGNGQGAGSGTPGGDTGTFFDAGTQARSVVYVIDRSSSMGFNGLLAAAVRELRASLGRLSPDARFQVIVYHDRSELLLPGPHELLPASLENVRRAGLACDAIRAEGGTEHLSALRLALSLNPEAIFFLTDADDLKDEDRREVTRLNRGRAVIHTIELTAAHRGRPEMPLQVLARENRGRYLAVDLGERRALRSPSVDR